jgi:hypothetical protein
VAVGRWDIGAIREMTGRTWRLPDGYPLRIAGSIGQKFCQPYSRGDRATNKSRSGKTNVSLTFFRVLTGVLPKGYVAGAGRIFRFFASTLQVSRSIGRDGSAGILKGIEYSHKHGTSDDNDPVVPVGRFSNLGPLPSADRGEDRTRRIAEIGRRGTCIHRRFARVCFL